MRRTCHIRIICALLLMSLPGLAFAESATELFISSFPLGAKIRINGETIPKRTPALIHQLKPGMYVIDIEREGYAPKSDSIVLGETPFAHHKVSLMPLYVKIPITSGAVIVNGQPVQKGEYGFMIPQGGWNIGYEEDRIKLDPAYPLEKNYTAAKTATLLLSALFASMTVYDLVTPAERNTIASPFTYVSLGLSLSAGAFWTGYALDKRNYLQSVTSLPLDTYPYTEFGIDKFQEAEKLLLNGQIYEALDAYTQLIAEYPGSNYIPAALYKTAKIYEIIDDPVLAGHSYRALVETFPLPEYYDKSCAALGRIHEAAKEYGQAITYYEKMIFFDPTYPKEEIEAKIESLRELEEQL